MATYTEPLTETNVFRKNNDLLGRHISVTRANSTNRHLSYGRIILREQTKSTSFHTAGRETGLIVLSGAAFVETAGQSFALERYDGMYIPRESDVHVRTSDETDIAEFSAGVEGDYPLQVIRHSTVIQNPTLRFDTGAPSQRRSISVV